MVSFAGALFGSSIIYVSLPRPPLHTQPDPSSVERSRELWTPVVRGGREGGRDHVTDRHSGPPPVTPSGSEAVSSCHPSFLLRATSPFSERPPRPDAFSEG